jgi:hypothetical protein
MIMKPTAFGASLVYGYVSPSLYLNSEVALGFTLCLMLMLMLIVFFFCPICTEIESQYQSVVIVTSFYVISKSDT